MTSSLRWNQSLVSCANICCQNRTKGENLVAQLCLGHPAVWLQHHDQKWQRGRADNIKSFAYMIRVSRSGWVMASPFCQQFPFHFSKAPSKTHALTTLGKTFNQWMKGFWTFCFAKDIWLWHDRESREPDLNLQTRFRNSIQCFFPQSTLNQGNLYKL